MHYAGQTLEIDWEGWERIWTAFEAAVKANADTSQRSVSAAVPVVPRALIWHSGALPQLAIWVQIALRRAQISVPGDLPKDMNGHAGISHPCQPGVPQAVTLELVVAKLGDDLVPASCIPKRGRGDTPTPRAGEKAGVRVTTGEVGSSLNQVADRVDGGGTPTRPGHTFPPLPPYAGSVRRFMSCMTQLVACTAMCFSAGAASFETATDTVRMPLS